MTGGRITYARRFQLMWWARRAFVDESRLKFFADEADEAVDLFGSEFFFKGGHAVAAFGYPFNILIAFLL